MCRILANRIDGSTFIASRSLTAASDLEKDMEEKGRTSRMSVSVINQDAPGGTNFAGPAELTRDVYFIAPISTEGRGQVPILDKGQNLAF